MAAGVKVEYHWNEPELARMLSDSGMVGAAVRRAAGATRDRAKENLTGSGNVDTGALRNSVRSERSSVSAQGVSYWVGSQLPYAGFVENGRGPVVPRRAKVLRFKPKGSSSYVFAPYAGPAEGSHWLQRALDALTPADFAG